MRMITTAILSLVLATSTALATWAQEWTRFHGPNGSGESETILPAKFEPKDFLWKTPIPGNGHSSPVIWGDRVFLLSADPASATRFVICLNAKDGTVLWTRDYPSKPHHLHDRSSYASSTPAVDEQQVYVTWSEPNETTLMALSHEGKEAWRANLGPFVSQHGFGTSPVLYEDLVIVNNSQDGDKVEGVESPGESFVIAYNKHTGEEVWRTPRASVNVSYTVPCIFKNSQGEDELICHSTGEGVYSLDPRTGKQNWSVADAFSMRTVSSPILAGGLIIGTTGSGGGARNYVAAIEPSSTPKVAYTIGRQAPYVPTPVAKENALFLWSDVGAVTCVDAKTGEVHWQGRGHEGDFSSSPIRAGDKVYCVSDDGVLVSIAADTSGLKVLGKTPLGQTTRATPAVSGGRMFVRTGSHVICLGNKAS